MCTSREEDFEMAATGGMDCGFYKSLLYSEVFLHNPAGMGCKVPCASKNKLVK